MKKRKQFLPVAMVFIMVGVMLSGVGVMAEEDVGETGDTPEANVEVLEMPVEDDSDAESRDYDLIGDGEIDEVLREHQDDLMAVEGVTSVTVMNYDGEPSIIVFVEEDADIEDGRIPAELDGYPVVVEVDYEVEIMPFGAEDDADSESGEDDAIIPDSEEAEDTATDPDEDAGDSNLIIYILGGVVIAIVLFLVLRKGS